MIIIVRLFCMKMDFMKTFSAKAHEVKRDWLLVDANGKTLGRLATAVASRLRGKHKAEFTPHTDTGDYIVIINAEKVKVTGKKFDDKMSVVTQRNLFQCGAGGGAGLLPGDDVGVVLATSLTEAIVRDGVPC